MTLSYKYHTFSVPLCLLRLLKRRMRWVRAAGCIVADEAGNMLLIRRNGRWDLPKGKVEPGETLLQAALRETLEETGIKVESGKWKVENHAAQDSGCPLSTFLFPLSTFKTYHIFNLYGGWHLKQTSWFAARAAGIRPSGKPQGEEGITETTWVSPDEWHRRLQSSYGTLRTLSESLKDEKAKSQRVEKSKSLKV